MIPTLPPHSWYMENFFLRYSVPGAKKAGDHCSRVRRKPVRVEDDTEAEPEQRA